MKTGLSVCLKCHFHSFVHKKINFLFMNMIEQHIDREKSIRKQDFSFFKVKLSQSVLKTKKVDKADSTFIFFSLLEE